MRLDGISQIGFNTPVGKTTSTTAGYGTDTISFKSTAPTGKSGTEVAQELSAYVKPEHLAKYQKSVTGAINNEFLPKIDTTKQTLNKEGLKCSHSTAAAIAANIE